MSTVEESPQVADLTVAARRRVLQVLELVRRAGKLDEDLFVLEDGGVSLGFSGQRLAREIVFVLPKDGSTLYFIARGDDGFRRAGIVLEDPAVEQLARWAADEAAEFSPRGLEVG